MYCAHQKYPLLPFRLPEGCDPEGNGLMDSAIIYLFYLLLSWFSLDLFLFLFPFSPLQSSWWYFPSFAFIGVENGKENPEFGDLGN